MNINFSNFLKYLPLMGDGMLTIIVVMCIIIVCISLLNKVFSKKR